MDFKVVREGLRRARSVAPTIRDGAPHVGMTLDEAAEKSGLNRATIHSIENLKREPNLKPELETIERLARAYGLTLLLNVTGIDDSSRSRKGGRSDHALSAAPSEETLNLALDLGRGIARIVQTELARRQAPATGTGGPGGHKAHRKNR